jgi:transcriptional regulator NrdR family protein
VAEHIKKTLFPVARLAGLVMRELKNLGKVAHLHFVSCHRIFENIDEFKRLVSEVRR